MSTATINPVTDRAAWLEERKRGIGASEAPAVLGLSPFEDATTLALRKLGRLPAVEESEAMELGTLMEPVLAELYQRRTGRAIVYQQVFRKDPKLPFLFATVDGVDSESELVEFKTTGAWSAKELGEEGTDEVPEHWLIQAHQQMHVCRKDVVNFAVLVGGQSFRSFTVRRNQALIDAMLPSLEQFWDTVQRGEVPESPATLYTPKILAALNPECSGEALCGPGFTSIVAEYERLKDVEKRAKEGAEGLKAEILKAMGKNEIGLLDDGRRLKRYLISMPERTQVVKAHIQHYFKITNGA